MSFFVFRNNTIERFFPKNYAFSGYGDISVIPADANGYVWFYQAPLGINRDVASEIAEYKEKFKYVLTQIVRSKTIIALTMDETYAIKLTDNDFTLKTAIEEYNDYLFTIEKEYSNVRVIDYSEFSRNYPNAELLDWKYYYISQMGINPKLSKDFQKWWGRKMDSIALKRKKCIVLDLDNTLWGGVLGEVGIGGIKIGGDYPGNAFSFFQKALLQLSKTGVILTVCSKNNEADVFEAWENNPFMILKKEHFVAYQINWQDKATNIELLAQELNLGLESFVFVDDNPSERELVKQLLPMVSVPDFPPQPYDLPLFFKRLVEDFFMVYSITDDDRNKTEQYKISADRARASHSFSDIESYLKSLDIQIVIEAANEYNISRIAQLTQKTNQFNMTAKRCTESDIRQFLESGWNIWCVSESDRFGDDGIVGAILVNGDTIDNYLLSCRVLGKGIETAVMKKVLLLLKELGLSSVSAKYIQTAKNIQVADFYDCCGFRCVTQDTKGNKAYVLDMEKAESDIKDYYHITVK